MKIANERYEMTFCEKGGEMTSFRDKQTDIQYLYQGDSEYWSGKNPTLFPIVGNTHSGTYEIDGKRVYAMIQSYRTKQQNSLPFFSKSSANSATFLSSGNSSK